MFDQVALGKRILERRKVQGLTQEQLGRALGVSAQAVSKWEVGEASPDIALLPALCKVLGTSADALLGIDGGIGIEALGNELARRLGQVTRSAEDAALLQTYRTIHFAGRNQDRGRDSDCDIGTAFCLEDGKPVRMLFWAKKGFVCAAFSGVLRDGQQIASVVEMLRVLVAPGCWEVAQCLLAGARRESALLESGAGETPEAVGEALTKLLDAGLIVREKEGYRLNSRAESWMAVLRGLCSVFSGPIYQTSEWRSEV